MFVKMFETTARSSLFHGIPLLPTIHLSYIFLAPTRLFFKMPRLDDSIKGETIGEPSPRRGSVLVWRCVYRRNGLADECKTRWLPWRLMSESSANIPISRFLSSRGGGGGGGEKFQRFKLENQSMIYLVDLSS